MSAGRRIYFDETQHITQVWIWAIIAIAEGLLAWAFVQQIVFGRPFGPQPATDVALWILLPTVGGLVPLFLLMARLRTTVTDRDLVVDFWPFSRWRITPDQIESFEARQYSPLLEYGGWGLRWSPMVGWAYSVRGRAGVQLRLRSGRQLMIGTQRPTDLAAAIQALRDEVGQGQH